jgi:hypothetical protein
MQNLIAILMLLVACQTQPATTTVPAAEIAVPAGFVLIDAGGRRALAEAADERWVRDVLASTPPTTRPSTMPADVLQRAVVERDKIVAGLATDLALPAEQVALLVDEYIIGPLRQLASIDPPRVYVVTTPDRLKQLVFDGWGAPRLRLNRLTGEVVFSGQVDVSLDRAAEPILLPTLYAPSTSAEQRAQGLAASVSKAEADTALALSRACQELALASLPRLLGKGVFDPMDLEPGQLWLALGVTGILTAEYAAPLAGVSPEQVLSAMSAEPEGAFVSSAGIDLLHPADVAQLRRERVPAYLDAMRRKSIIAVQELTGRAGRGAIPKVLTAVRTEKPADGAALVQIITRETGLDLGPALSKAPADGH